MPTSLRSALNDLASNFASAVLDAIRSASLADLHAESGGAPRRSPGRPKGSAKKVSRATLAFRPAPKNGQLVHRDQSARLARRSPADIARTLGQVVTLVKGSKAALRSEEIRKALKLDVREVPRVLKEGLAKKKLRSKGQKRATTYTAA